MSNQFCILKGTFHFMKNVLTLLGFILVLTVLWYSVKESKKTEFKNNLPETTTIAPIPKSDLRSDLASKPLEDIPLLTEKDFELNEKYKPQLITLYSFIFDSLQVLKVVPSQIRNSSLSYLKASTIIQLNAFHNSVAAHNPEKRAACLLTLGLWLNNSSEVQFYVENYLFEENRWLFQMKKLHLLLLQEPKDELLNEVFLTLLQPANSAQTLDYLKLVQFLDQGPTDEYFHVNKEVLNRLDPVLLKAILDKVDDYSWWAAYPERDAEQGILEILGEEN